MAKDTFDDMFGDDTPNNTTSEKAIESTVPDKVDDISVDQDVKQDDSDQITDTNPEMEKLKKQIERLNKSFNDSRNWGLENRETYIRAKKKTEELVQKLNDRAKKLNDEGTLFDDEYESFVNDYKDLSTVFERDLNDNFSKDEVKENTPINNVLNNLKKTFEEYKNWNDEKDLDYKFNAFFKDLDLVTDKRFNEIQDYMLGETDQKALLRYVLDKGTASYENFYKPIGEEGDAFSYVKKLLTKNEKLEKELKELKLELDDTEERVNNRGDDTYTYSPKKKGAYDQMFGD